MEAARALLGGIAAAVSGRAVSGSAASGPGTPRWRELRPGYNRLDRRSAGEARFAVAPRAGEVRCFARDSVRWFAGTPTKGSGWRGSHVLPTTCRRGARVTTNSVADATGGDPGDDKTRSPPSRPRRGRNVRSSSASPGSSFSETAAADTAPTQNTRAAAAAKRLRSTNMKSPAATKALSSVRATAGAGARVGRGEDGRGGLSRERENVYESEPPRERVPNDRASHRETEVGNATVNSLPTLRKEASTILRALGAARAAPGGLRGAFGNDADLPFRVLDALCGAGMVVQASSLLREAIAVKVPLKPDALECVVRHAALAGRARESGALAAFCEYRANAMGAGGKSDPQTRTQLPTLRTYTDLISALGKAEARRRRRRNGAVGSSDVRGSDASATYETNTSDSSGELVSSVSVASSASVLTLNANTVTAIEVWEVLLLDSRSNTNLTPDGAAYTAAVAAHLVCNNAEQAELLTREMRRAGVEAGPRLYNVLMTHRGLVNDLDGIRRVERQMRISGVRPNSATHGARVAAYARCGELVLAERALESGRNDPRPYARPTVRAYTALVQALAKKGNVGECRRWLSEMSNDGVTPNAHTYTVVVDGLVSFGDAKTAESVVQEMRIAGVEPTAVTYNCLLRRVKAGGGGAGVGDDDTSTRDDDSGKESREGATGNTASTTGTTASTIGTTASTTGATAATTTTTTTPRPSESPRVRLARAKRVLAEMREFGVATTVVTFNTLIDACVDAGEPTEQMFGILSNLIAAGHRPDVVTYTTLLKHFSREGDVVAARWLMREMETDSRVVVDLSAFNALIDAFTRKGLTREAVDTVAKMKTAGHVPDAATYGALLDGFARVGDGVSASRLYHALKGKGSSGNGRQWRPSWSDTSDEQFLEVTPTAPSPDSRMRFAVVAACALGVALGTADPEDAQGVVEGIIADAAALGVEPKPAQEAIALRQKWGKESVMGQTVARSSSAGSAYGANRRHIAGGSYRPAGDSVAFSGSRKDRRRDARAAGGDAVRGIGGRIEKNVVDANAQIGSRDETFGVTRSGFEMWKHWLGLPSRYYVEESGVNGPGVGGGGANTKGDAKAPLTVAENALAKRRLETSSESSESSSRSFEPFEIDTSEKKKYTRTEIARAVATLRAAASKKFPKDPESALRLALDASAGGDTKRFSADDDEEDEVYYGGSRDW